MIGRRILQKNMTLGNMDSNSASNSSENFVDSSQTVLNSDPVKLNPPGSMTPTRNRRHIHGKLFSPNFEPRITRSLAKQMQIKAQKLHEINESDMPGNAYCQSNDDPDHKRIRFYDKTINDKDGFGSTTSITVSCQKTMEIDKGAISSKVQVASPPHVETADSVIWNVGASSSCQSIQKMVNSTEAMSETMDLEGDNDSEESTDIDDDDDEGESENENENVENDDVVVMEEVDAYAFIRSLPPLPLQLRSRVPVLPVVTRSTKQICLVLDLDETLVHCSLNYLDKHDFSFWVKFQGQDYKVYARLRPHLFEFLDEMSKDFELVLFTASKRVYANKLLNILDPKNTYFRYRLFREHCVCVNGNYIKDLSILGRDMSRTVIVDNSPQAFGYQVENGVPIESWFMDKTDQELFRLKIFFRNISNFTGDVRPLLIKQFRVWERVYPNFASRLRDTEETDSELFQQLLYEARRHRFGLTT